MSDLLQRIGDHIRDRRLLVRSQPVLAAVSGGLDSMALVHLLHMLAARHRWKLTVAHFNHQLRGRSSDADERLVRKIALEMGLPVAVERADVGRFADISKLSIEMAARKLRHEFFARAAKERNIRIVALAHHTDDQVELFFLRLLRGAGGEGLAGMRWRSPSPVDGSVTLIRPLLDVTKAELREFALEHKIRFREDATNALLVAPRNRIRNELLPLLRKKYQPGLTKTVLRLMEIIGAEADAVGDMARQWLWRRRGDETQTKKSETPYVVSSSFEQLPVAVQRRVLQSQLEESGVLADFELVERLRRSPGVFVSVSPKCSVARDPAGLVKLRTEQPIEFKANELTVRLADRAGELDFAGLAFHWTLKRSTGPRGRPSRQTEFFDADKIGEQITLRHWRPGDRFQPIGLNSALKLQDWFVNQGIPRLRRRQLVVATAESGEIFWIEGLRIGENFKLTPRTTRWLVWRWRRQGPKGTFRK